MSEYWQRVQNIQYDAEQQIVFDQDVSRVVIAGPGSGKTYLLTTKIAKLLHTEAVKAPHRIACLTFSNLLANQLREDLQALEVLNDERVFVGTVHSFCIAEIILPFQKLYRLRIPNPLRIASWEEMLDATKQALLRQYLCPPDKKYLLENVTSNLNNYRRIYWDTDREDFPENSSDVSQLYPGLNWAQFSENYSSFLWREENPSVDFVQLEIESLKTIKSHPLVQRTLAARYTWWVIDEYQDLGLPFHQMMMCLLQNTKLQLLAIGDPDQCIYEEMQGSKPKLIYELTDIVHEQGGADQITLRTNYRSVQDIIDLSEIVLGEKRGYLANTSINVVNSTSISYYIHRKSLQSNLIKELLNDLKQNKGLQLGQIAILHPYRKGAAGLNEISYMLDGGGWANVLDKDPEYNHRVKLVGWIEQLAKWCTKDLMSKRPYFYDVLPTWFELISNDYGHTIFEERLKHEKHLFEVLWNLRNVSMDLKEWLDALRENLELDPIIESYEGIRPDDAIEFFRLCEAVETGKRLRYWTVARFAKGGKRIQLTTLHSSKGTQFEAVIVAGFDRIGFGDRKYSPKSLDRRLAYVGVTRAKTYLFLLHSDQRAYFVSRINNASNDIIEYWEYDGRDLRRK